MKYKAAMASFLVLAVYGVLARATDDFTSSNSGEELISAMPEEKELLVPHIDGYSGRNDNSVLRQGKSSRYSKSRKYEPTSRDKYQTGDAFGATASKSPATESSEGSSWAIAWIAVGGAAGAVVALAVGQWRRAKRRRKRAPVPALLLATLSENQSAIARPRKAREQSEAETRRAA